MRDRLEKIGAKIVRPGRSIAVRMAEIMVPRTLFQQILNANAVASVATSLKKWLGFSLQRFGSVRWIA